MWPGGITSEEGKVSWDAAGKKLQLVTSRDFHCQQSFLCSQFLEKKLREVPGRPKGTCYIAYVCSILDYATVNPVCNDHLNNKIYYLWFIQ